MVGSDTGAGWENALIPIEPGDNRQYWRDFFILEWMRRRTTVSHWCLAETLLWIIHRDERHVAEAMFDWSDPNLPNEKQYRSKAERGIGNFYEMSAVTAAMSISQKLNSTEVENKSGRTSEWASKALFAALKGGGVQAKGLRSDDPGKDLNDIPRLYWDSPAFEFNRPPEVDGSGQFRAQGKVWSQVLFNRENVIACFAPSERWTSEAEGTSEGEKWIASQSVISYGDQSTSIRPRGDDSAETWLLRVADLVAAVNDSGVAPTSEEQLWNALKELSSDRGWEAATIRLTAKKLIKEGRLREISLHQRG